MFVEELFSFYNSDDILTKEAKQQQIPIDVWGKMQSYHDGIAQNNSKTNMNGIVGQLEQLTGFEFPELMFE